VQNGSIPLSDWNFLLRHRRAQQGWALSLITTLELLAGLDGISEANFPGVRKQFRLAWALSHGRVLEDPMPLICRDVLKIPFPADLVAPAATKLREYLDVVRYAVNAAQLRKGVPYKGGTLVLDDLSVVKNVVQDIKARWTAALEDFLTSMYPSWREHHQEHGKRLPLEMRREREPIAAWVHHEREFITNLLCDMLKASPDSALVDKMMQGLDAVLKFTTAVVRDFSITNYSIEKRASDALDQFQLRYLAMDKYVLVTNDTPLSTKTAKSSQAHRIMNFENFLRTL
jgi:hypothetical protein